MLAKLDISSLHTVCAHLDVGIISSIFLLVSFRLKSFDYNSESDIGF